MTVSNTGQSDGSLKHDTSLNDTPLRFSERCRQAAQPYWQQAVTHKFTVELGRGELDLDVYRHYLIQDYAFVEHLVNMVATALAKAPHMSQKHFLADFLAAVTSTENTFFIRSFEALGVTPEQYQNPVLTDVSQAFLHALNDASEQGYYDAIATLSCAEWVYQQWGEAQQHQHPEAFYFREWIDLHANDGFTQFVQRLLCELDQCSELDDATQTRLINRFVRMAQWENDFFNSAYAHA